MKQFQCLGTGSVVQGVKYEANKKCLPVYVFLSRKIHKQSTRYYRPVSSQLVLPPRDVLWAVGFCFTSASLTPLPPLLHRTTKISPPLLLPLEARKQACLSASLSVALALTALASVGIVRAAPLPPPPSGSH
jgi:hypothetical protein